MTRAELAHIYVSFYRFHVAAQHNRYLAPSAKQVDANLRLALRSLLAAGYTRHQIRALQRGVIAEVMR